MKCIRRLNPTQRSIQDATADSRVDVTRWEADTSQIRQPEKQKSVSLISGIFVGPQPELEEHILFVLHPMWAEKGDLL
jgi:hypothetical protein